MPDTTVNMNPDFDLELDAFGRLVLLSADGQRHEAINPVRAFPLAAPDEGLSLVDRHGKEQVWIPRLDALPERLRQLLAQQMAQSEFVPEIRRIVAVSTFSTPSLWDVDTDRGPTRLLLKGEEDIRRLGGGALLLTDGQGIVFRIADRGQLDRPSRRLLERFL